MKRIIVLVGPPGVGKSTLVKLAKDKGTYAVDIEDVHNEVKKLFEDLPKPEYQRAMAAEMKIQIDKLLNETPDDISLFGAGSYGGFFPPEQIERILLLPPWEIYLKRWQERDTNNDEKKLQAQKGEEIYNYFLGRTKGENDYHKIIREVGTPEEILNIVLT